jgi:hypothetical protein
MSTATDLIWRARGGILRHGARRVRRHILESSPQPVDDVVIVYYITGHPRRVIVAGVLVP